MSESNTQALNDIANISSTFFKAEQEQDLQDPEDSFEPRKLDAGFVSICAAYQIVHGLSAHPSTAQYKPWADRIMQTEKIRVFYTTGLKNRAPYFYMEDVERLKRRYEEEKAAKAKKTPDLFANVPSLSQPFFTVKDICALLNVGDSVVYKAIREGRLKSVRFENCIRITKDDLDKYLHGSSEPEKTMDYGYNAEGEKVVF